MSAVAGDVETPRAPGPSTSPAQLRLAGLAFALGVLLHVDRVPPWCSGLALAVVAWRLLPHRRAGKLPPAWLRIALALCVGALVLLSARGLGSLASGTALLVGMGAAKLLETRRRRDLWVMVAVPLFLTLAALLDRQDLARLPWYALCTWLACGALASIGSEREAARAGLALREAGGALAWALPFAVLAFVAFPRLSGGLWSLPGTQSGTTGLSDTMSPGSLAELAVSDAIAFRARFDGPVPPPQARYWRGPVLHEFDGATWSRARTLAPRPHYEPQSEPLRYHVTLEPHGHGWWFALDVVADTPSPGVFLGFDRELRALRPVTRVTSYDAVSWLQARSTSPLSRVERRMDTRLTGEANPRARALGREWAAHAQSPRALVTTALDFFRSQGLRYSLAPGLQLHDPVDDFLFDTREGFCGHFASAFALLMRSAGLPARVVTGYQGGEWNRLGGYLVVRQSDAHAWVEVWLENEGWMRVDPTAVAAPERLTRGLAQLMPGSGDATARFLRRNGWLASALRGWDAANTWWRGNVLEFDASRQLRLLERLGLPGGDTRMLAVVLGAGALLWAAVALWRTRGRERAPPRDRSAREWRRLQRALIAAGLGGKDSEAPGALAARVATAAPELTHPIQQARLAWEQLRFAREPADPQDLRARQRLLERAVDRVQWRLKQRRREAAWPLLDAAQQSAVAEALWYYDVLPVPLRERVLRLARRLLRTVPLIGCNGFVLDERMRAVIAFQACLLVATRDLTLYRPLRSVLVYPDEFVVQEREEDEAGVVTEGERELSGQTIEDTRIVLSWADVESGLAAGDGYNVVLHEFAHFLDHVAGGALSGFGSSPGEWQQTLHAEYQRLCADVEAGEETLIDPYGAEDPVEFFAVATEVFFELPLALHTRHAGLYAALSELYGLDPAEWELAASAPPVSEPQPGPATDP